MRAFLLGLLLLPLSCLAATDVFYSAAGAVSPVDGWARRGVTSETLATIRAGAGVTSSSGSAAQNVELQASTTSNQYNSMIRVIALFNTASLSGLVVDSGTFSIKSGFVTTALGDPGYEITSSSPAADDAIQNSDYSQLGSTALATSILFSNISTSVYNDFTLNAAGIANVNTEGISKFGARTSWDLNNSFTGSWVSGARSVVSTTLADTSGTASDPKLTIESSLAAGGDSPLFFSYMYPLEQESFMDRALALLFPQALATR